MRWARRRGRDGAGADTPGETEAREHAAALEALRTTTAREVMTPRVDVVALAMPVTAEAVARAVRESAHSRFPVYEEDLDRLAGVLYVKDLFRIDGETTSDAIARRLRKPFVVPESRRVGELLHEMRTQRRAFAVVVDEYGGVAGVLTVKDLVSELVGELPDEFDRPEEADVTRIDQTRWLADGQVSVDRVRDELGIPIPEGEYVTFAGFLLDLFGRVPAEGDAIDFGAWHFRVNRMDRRRIAEVVARCETRRPAGGEPPAGVG